jgi:hypothetical protein
MDVEFSARCSIARTRMACGHLEQVLLYYDRGRPMTLVAMPAASYRTHQCSTCRGLATAVEQGRRLIEETRRATRRDPGIGCDGRPVPAAAQEPVVRQGHRLVETFPPPVVRRAGFPDSRLPDG